MKRVAFLTDQHFDVSSRWDETLRIARWCEGTIDDLEVDAIALGGDMLERRPCPLETRAVCEHVQRLADIAPVVGVYGNHDVPESLAPLNLLEARFRIQVVDTPQTVEAGDVLFQLLPWPRRAQLLAAAGAGVSREEAGALGYEALQNLLRGMGAHRWDGPNCFIGHVQLAGARVSTGQPLAPGGDFELGLGDLALAKADAYLLGHIHLGVGNDWTIEGAPALYGGSFRRTAFGEVEEKTLVIATFPDVGGPASIERIPIPTTAMILIDGWYDPNVPGIEGGALSTSSKCDVAVRGAEIRLRYRCASDQREAARRLALRVRDELLQDGAKLVKLEEVVTVETRSRHAEVARAVTPEEKLEAFRKAKGFDPGARREPLRSKFSAIREETH